MIGLGGQEILLLLIMSGVLVVFLFLFLIRRSRAAKKHGTCLATPPQTGAAEPHRSC